MAKKSTVVPKQAAESDVDPVDWWRLTTVCALTLVGWIGVAFVVLNDHSNIKKHLSIDLEGLSPAVRACYAYHSKSSPIIIAFAIGITLGVSYVFGTFLYKKFRETSKNERQLFYDGINDLMKRNKSRDLRELMGEFREYEKAIIDRRNVFWSLLTRVTLAILVVGLIGLLMSTCKIESQAGLPIISGIIAFIIGQGSELLHSGSSPVLQIRTDGEPEKDEPSRPKRRTAAPKA